jgi:hypothetical protein
MLLGSANAQTSKQTQANNTKAGAQVVLRSEPDPPKAGENQFEVTVKNKNGKAITGADVSVVFVMPAMPAMNMAETRQTVKLTPAGEGVYRGKGKVPMAGRWNVTVTVSEHGRTLANKKLTITAK